MYSSSAPNTTGRCAGPRCRTCSRSGQEHAQQYQQWQLHGYALRLRESLFGFHTRSFGVHVNGLFYLLRPAESLTLRG
jgi:hypothetical protein